MYMLVKVKVTYEPSLHWDALIGSDSSAYVEIWKLKNHLAKGGGTMIFTYIILGA